MLNRSKFGHSDTKVVVVGNFLLFDQSPIRQHPASHAPFPRSNVYYLRLSRSLINVVKIVSDV